MKRPRFSAAQIAVIAAAIVFAVLYICLACHFLAEIKEKELPLLRSRVIGIPSQWKGYIFWERQGVDGDAKKAVQFTDYGVCIFDRTKYRATWEGETVGVTVYHIESWMDGLISEQIRWRNGWAR